MFAKSIGQLLARAPNFSSRAVWSTELTSGRRRYRCRALYMTFRGKRHTVVLIERTASKLAPISRLFDAYRFTRREQETAALIAQGLTNKEIAARLEVSVNTVKAFVRSVMQKLGVSTRTGIVSRFAQTD